MTTKLFALMALQGQIKVDLIKDGMKETTAHVAANRIISQLLATPLIDDETIAEHKRLTAGGKKPEIKDLLAQYDKETGFHSLAGPMRQNAAFQEIVAQGKTALPDVLEYLRDTQGGMSIILILSDITKENPLPPKTIAPGFVGYDVAATREAWLTWGREKGHLPA